MAFGEFQVTVLDSQDRPVRSYAWRADTPGNVPRDSLQLDGVWHEVVKVASEPDPESRASTPALRTTVYCRRMESVPSYLAGRKRKRHLSLITDAAADVPTLRVEVAPAPTARSWRPPVRLIAVGIALAAFLALAAVAAHALHRPAPRRIELPATAPPAVSAPRPAPVVAPAEPAAPPARAPAPAPKPRRKQKQADLIDPWENP